MVSAQLPSGTLPMAEAFYQVAEVPEVKGVKFLVYLHSVSNLKKIRSLSYL